MNERREKAGGFEIAEELRFGGKTLILGFSDRENAKLPYMTCFKETNLLHEVVFTDAFLSNDYLEVMEVFSERLRNAVRRVKGARNKRNVPFSVLTAEHCLPDEPRRNLAGKLVVITPSSLAPEYRTSDFQLGLAVGDSECEHSAGCRKIFFRELFSGKTAEWSFKDILGVANPEKLPAWAQKKLKQHRKRYGGTT